MTVARPAYGRGCKDEDANCARATEPESVQPVGRPRPTLLHEEAGEKHPAKVATFKGIDVVHGDVLTRQWLSKGSGSGGGRQRSEMTLLASRP